MLKLTDPGTLIGERQVVVAVVSSREDDTGRVQEMADGSIATQRFGSVSALLELDAETARPHLIVIFQKHCDEYAFDAADTLARQFPLTRFLVVLGPLCESERRTRACWPFAWQVPDWKFPLRFESELDVLRGSTAALPSTASLEEVARYELKANSKASSKANHDLLLFSPDAVWAETLRLQLGATGNFVSCGDVTALTKFVEEHPEATVLIDLDPLTPELEKWLGENIDVLGNRHCIGFTNWPGGKSMGATKRWPFAQIHCKLTPGLSAVLGR